MNRSLLTPLRSLLVGHIDGVTYRVIDAAYTESFRGATERLGGVFSSVYANTSRTVSLELRRLS